MAAVAESTTAGDERDRREHRSTGGNAAPGMTTTTNPRTGHRGLALASAVLETWPPFALRRLITEARRHRNGSLQTVTRAGRT